MDDDFALLERWRGGDHRAGEALVARHVAEIHRFFTHKVSHDAEDLAQRTFLACIAGRDRFQGRASFRTYLFAIARHELHHHLRRAAGREHVDLDSSSIAEIVTSAGSRLAREQRGELLRAALRQLPVDHQLLLELHYWHDLDAADLAQVFDATSGAIRVRLTRARAALRQKLAERGPDAVSEVVGDGSDRLAASVTEEGHAL